MGVTRHKALLCWEQWALKRHFSGAEKRLLPVRPPSRITDLALRSFSEGGQVGNPTTHNQSLVIKRSCSKAVRPNEVN